MSVVCPACGYAEGDPDGPTHAYLTVSPGCWSRFNESMALHYSDLRFWAAHQLLTDAYCLQHSIGTERRAVQSAAIHLAALVAQMDDAQTGNDDVVRLRKAMAARTTYPKFDPFPRATATIAMVSVDDDPAGHLETTRTYAAAVFADWQPHHDRARAMIAEALT